MQTNWAVLVNIIANNTIEHKLYILTHIIYSREAEKKC